MNKHTYIQKTDNRQTRQTYTHTNKDTYRQKTEKKSYKTENIINTESASSSGHYALQHVLKKIPLTTPLLPSPLN